MHSLILYVNRNLPGVWID
jgi:hypothetical protein